MSLLLLRKTAPSSEPLAAPTDIYIGEDSAQSGETTPAIHITVPKFSAIMPSGTYNFVSYEVRVSAPDDADFSEELSWNSGVQPFAQAWAPESRCEDITYGGA